MSRIFVALTLLTGYSGPVYAEFARAPASAASPSSQARSNAGHFKLPLYFEANRGQTDASVKFFTRAAGYNLYLTASEAVMVLSKSAVVRMKLKGANAKASIKGRDVLPWRTSYFFGNDPSKWQVGVQQFAGVKYSQVYPGIDMVYHGNQGQVEYDFIVAPGANPSRILLGFDGGKDLRLDARGNLIVRVEGGELTYQAPKLYQTLGGKRSPVQGRFALAGNKQARFEVGDYIRSEELVIDPQMVWSTYLGGSVDDKITSVAVDGTQQVYVTGWSRSAPSGAGGFPAATATFPGAIGANRGGADVFVAKLSSNGATLMWLAWMGGALDDQANGIALDASSASTPNVYITGVTASGAFPVVGNPTVLQACAGMTGTLAFVAELTQPANIPNLVYSTCWGGVQGTLTNTANGIAVDSLGAAYVTGTTFATNFPISLGIPAPYNTMGAASQDAFVLKIAPSGTAVSYSMLLGPSSTITNGNAIAVDTGFQAWVTGMTTSSTLPAVIGHFSSSFVGTSDVFVAEVNTSGTGLLYATYINGNSDQAGTAIALDHAGATPYNVFVAGWTVSPTGFPSTAYYNLPTAGPGSRPVVYQKNLSGADDPFILRLDPAAVNPAPGTDNPQEMIYATHLGATAADRAYALALDDRDDAYIAGWTLSSNWTLAADPVTPDANGKNVTGATTQNTSGGQDAFVAAIGPTGQYQPFFAYLGATPPGQAATGIAIDAAHNIYVVGFTPSAIFPLETGALMDGSVASKSINGTGTAGAFDGFITKIAPVVSFGLPLPAVCTISGVNPNSGFALGGNTVTITGTGFGAPAGPGGVTFDSVNASTYTVNAASTVITATAPRHPLVGAFVYGTVPLTVTTGAGSCSSTYSYVVAPVAAPGGPCGEDFFFPSPATGASASFAYCMELAGTARIRVYNVIGDLAAKIEETKPSGAAISTLNTARLAPGVYLYRLQKDYGSSSTTSSVKKFVVAR
jgi:hypothetical protein